MNWYLNVVDVCSLLCLCKLGWQSGLNSLAVWSRYYEHNCVFVWRGCICRCGFRTVPVELLGLVFDFCVVFVRFGTRDRSLWRWDVLVLRFVVPVQNRVHIAPDRLSKPVG